MPTTYYPEPDVIDALQECRALAFELGRVEGREEAARFMRTAASLNGHGPNIFKAIETGEAFAESDQSADPHDALTLAYIDSLIETKTHDPESTDSEVGSVLSHWFSDPEAFSEALAEVDGLDAPTIEKAVRQIHKAWEEQQHPRDHGKFAESEGATNADETSEQNPVSEWHDLPTLQTAADGWARRILKAAIRIPGSLMASVRARANAAYDRLSSRYGKGFARAAVAAGVVGLAIPLPGASVIAAAPVVAIAELHRQLAGVTAEGEPSLIRKAADWLVDRVSGGTEKLKDDPLREIIQKAWDASLHPRDDHGRFLSKEAIHEAKSDPAKAEALRSRVTDPTQRAKLDAALGGSVDLGRTKAGEAKEETERKRTDKSERLAKVRSLSNEISMARRGGEPVPASHFASLAEHLPHLTVQELRSVRIKLAASFAGGRRRDEMAQALTRHAKNQVERLNAEEKYSDLDPLDFGSLTDYSNQFNSRGPHGNPNSAESHGGRMDQRAELDRAVTGKPVDTGSLNHVKDRWTDELLREGVHKAWDASEHPRGQPENAGEFGPGGGKGESSKDKSKEKPSKEAKPSVDAVVPSPATEKYQEQAKAIVKDRIRDTKQRAFDPNNPSGTPVTGQLAGAIGEEVLIQHLKSLGYADAGYTSSFIGSVRNNIAFDLIHDHQLIEAKTGQANNTTGVWALKYDGKFNKQQEAKFAKMTPENVAKAKKKINAAKVKAIHDRKEAFASEMSKKLGHKIKPGMMTVIINPDSRTADIYQFDGLHDRIPFNSEMAQAAYVKSVKYG